MHEPVLGGGMATSYDIRLPRSEKPIFPDRCIRCGVGPALEKLSIWTSTQGWWTFLTLFFGTPVRVLVPVCPHCRWMIRLQRWGDNLLVSLFVLAAIFAFMPYIEPHVPRALAKYVVALLLVVCMSPYLLWKWFWPPDFDVTAHDNSIDYEFKSEIYAAEFITLNEDAKVV